MADKFVRQYDADGNPFLVKFIDLGGGVYAQAMKEQVPLTAIDTTPQVGGNDVSAANRFPVDAPIGNLATSTVTIAVGASLSGVLDTAHKAILAFSCPAGMEGTAFTFQTSYDAITYQDLYDKFGTEVSVTVAASRNVRVDLSDHLHARYWKIRTGTAAVPVVQAGADAVITVAMRQV